MKNLYFTKKSTYQNIKKKIEEISKQNNAKKIKIVGIIAAYNEQDIIGHVLKDFISKGIQVYFIDHHSTDNTLEQAKKFKGKGVIGLETFPEESGYPDKYAHKYVWRHILKRKEKLHSKLGAGWYMHMDADAIVESPWEGMPISKAIGLVDALGYNCINFELFNFRPVEKAYKKNIKPQDFFKYWEPADSFDELQIKCWKNFGQKIDLVTSAGHNVEFKGKKVFPIKFIMKHYPIRCSEQGIKKIYSERLPRLDPEEKKNDWHVQYDKYINKKDIKFKKENLLQYDEKIVRQIYLPLMSFLTILDDKTKVEYQLLEMNRRINFIYASRTWKAGRIVTAPWRLCKRILNREKN